MSGRPSERTTGRVLGVAAILLVVVTAASAPVAAHAGDDGFHHHDGWMGTHGGASNWVGGFGVLWMIVWTVVLIGVPVAFGYLWFTRRDPGGETADEALDLLRRRYAQGEIDDEEFETRRRKLSTEQN